MSDTPPLGRLEAMGELYRRGKLPQDMASAYEELGKRGKIPGFQSAAKAPTEEPGMLKSLASGAMHGLGDMLYGGAQIGARMGEAQQTPFGPELQPGATQRVDQATQQREAAFAGSKAATANPISSGIGRALGNIAATAPLMAIPGVGPAMAGPGMLGRLGVAGGLGAATGALQPAVVQPGGSFGAAKAKQAAEGAVGGLAGGALGEAVGSTLGKAIAGNSVQAIEKFMNETFRRVVKPTRIGRWSAPQMTAQDRNIVTAIDQIIENKGQIQLTDAMGEQLPLGSTPRSLRQFAEAIDQAKQNIFNRYDALAQSAGQTGVKVGVLPAAQQLRQIADQAGMREVPAMSGVRNQMLQLAQNLENKLFLSPSDTQDLIKTLNRLIAPEMRTFGHSPAAPVIKTLRQGLDTAIEAAVGPGAEYQILKNRYGALRDIEKDVGGAVAREANKISGGLIGQFLDAGSAVELLHGVLTLSPEQLIRAGGTRAAKAALKHVNDPNRAISRIFERRQQPTTGPMRGWLGGGVSMYAPPFGGLLGGSAASQPTTRRDLRPSVGGP